MNTIFSYLNDSVIFSDRQKKITLKLLQFFKNYIPNANGYFLYDLNLNKIYFKWCPFMTLNNLDSSGAWSLFSINSIYVRMPLQHKELFNICDKNIQIQKNQDKKENYIKAINSRKMFQNLKNRFRVITYQQKNLQDLIFLDYLIGQKILITIFHQLYHRWQFQVSGYIPYIFNYLIACFIPYEKQCEIPFFVEYDVRKNIERQELFDAIGQFYQYFNNYLVDNAYIINNKKQIQQLMLKEKLSQQDIISINNYQDKIIKLNQYKNTNIKTKRFVYQLIEFCKEI